MTAGCHFQYDINENITIELGIFPQTHRPSLNKHCIVISFGVVAEIVKIVQSRCLPGGHFDSDISKNITIELSIPQNPMYQA